MKTTVKQHTRETERPAKELAKTEQLRKEVVKLRRVRVKCGSQPWHLFAYLGSAPGDR